MKIETVKYTTGGYVLNNQFFIPDDSGKPTETQDFYYIKIMKWIAAGGIVEPEFTDQELLSNAKISKISQIKSISRSLILATYPSYKQSNILMSQDDDLIEQMNSFILPIRVKSNELEADLNLLTDLEEIENFKIEF